MQKDSLVGDIHNVEDNLYHERKNLKVILKLIFRRRFSKEYAPCIRMSDLRDEFATNSLTEENSKMDDTLSKYNVKPEIVNINLDQSPTQSKELTKLKQKTKTIKVNITISKEDDTQEEQIEDNVDNASLDKKFVKDKFCVVEQRKNSFSVVLKMPKNEEKSHCYNMSQEEAVPLNGNEVINSKNQEKPEMCLNAERNNDYLEDTVKNIATKYQFANKNKIKEVILQFLAQERLSSEISNFKQENEILRKQVLSHVETIKEIFNERLEKEKIQCTPNTKEKKLLGIQSRESRFPAHKEISNKLVSKNFIATEKRETNTPQTELDGQYSQGYRSNDDLSPENNKDSNIIHDIIMEHYQDVLHYFSEKRANRSINKSITLIEENKDHADDMDRPPVSYFYEDIKENTERSKSLESGLYDMDCSRTVNSFECADKKDEEVVEYDSREFLKAALGEDMMSVTTNSQVNLSGTTPLPTTIFTAKYGTEKSVGSSEISTLVSTIDDKSGIYSTVKKTRKTLGTSRQGPAARALFSSVSSSYNYYESVDKLFELDSKSDELVRNISLLEGIAAQASNAINICKCNPKLYGSECHLEAERILLHATYKMDFLNTELNKCEYVAMDQKKIYGTITINGLKFVKVPSIKIQKKKSMTQYYLCIVHSGTTVIATNITTAEEKSGEIIFRNRMEFTYDGLLSEVEIKISVYLLSIRNEGNKVNCFPIGRFNSPHKRSVNNSVSDMSHVQLLGKSRIGIRELSFIDKLRLNDVPLEAPISDTFDANVVVTLRLNNKYSGFLNINSRHTLWNRRWCVLDGFLLKYWSCPSQENEVKPLRILDLQKCVGEKVAAVDRSICSRPKTFVLEFQSKDMLSPERYLLSAESLQEFQRWTGQIDTTLLILKEWNKLKCQTVLLNN